MGEIRKLPLNTKKLKGWEPPSLAFPSHPKALLLLTPLQKVINFCGCSGKPNLILTKKLIKDPVPNSSQAERATAPRSIGPRSSVAHLGASMPCKRSRMPSKQVVTLPRWVVLFTGQRGNLPTKIKAGEAATPTKKNN